jgi:hypothetical protein
MLLTILFFVFFIGIFGKLIGFALKASWSLIKVILYLVALPLILVGLVFSGLIFIAIPILAIVGLATLFKAVLA